MKLSNFLKTFSIKHGREILEGAMVFVSLDRPLDQVIRHALALGSYHPGKPGRWSHCFLIAEEYHGVKTRILDCSIRDKKGRIIWDSTLAEDIDVLIKGIQGKGGKIYNSQVSDYDHEEVQDCGLYYLPDLSAKERHKIVRMARKLQSEGFRYDLPGLAREWVRLLIGVSWKPGRSRLLFCSAFLAKVYRAAFGKAWNIAPGIPSARITLDEIWYSRIGARA